MRQALALLAVVGALLVAVSAGAPTEYVMVRLLFDGHDQPNFDMWHANATVQAVAKAAGVPTRYVVRVIDGKMPADAAKPAKPAEAPKPKQEPAKAAPAPKPAAEPPQVPVPAPQPAPAPAAAPASEPIELPVQQAPAPASASLITDSTTGQAAAPADQAVKTDGTKPESAEAQLSTQQQPQQQQPQQPQPLLQQLATWVRGGRPQAELDAEALAQQQQQVQGQEQQQTQDQQGQQQPQRRRGTRVIVINGRRMLAVGPNQAEAVFAIRTNASEPWAVKEVVKRKLLSSAAGFGMAGGNGLKGIYTLLKENGVTYYPAMWVDGVQVLAGQMSLSAPHNRFINGSKEARSFAHKLFDPRDLAPNKPKPANATNVTVAEPAFVMANRSTALPATERAYAAKKPQRSGLPGWATAIIVLGCIAAVVALGASVWRCLRERRARQAELESDSHEEPLSPQSAHSHESA